MNEQLDELINSFDSFFLIDKPSIPIIGREKDIQTLLETFYKKRMQNSIIIGSAGCGKTALVQQLNCELQKHKMKQIIVGFSCLSAVSGTKYRGDFEEKIQRAINKIKQFNKDNEESAEIVLFIDELHIIMQLSNEGGEHQTLSFCDIIKPLLSNGEIKIIGATTEDEFNQFIKKDKALTRRFSVIKLNPLNKNEVVSILKKFSNNKIDDTLLEYIYDKSLNLKGINPDISIEICDRSMAKSIFNKEKFVSKDTIDKVLDSMSNYVSSVIS